MKNEIKLKRFDPKSVAIYTAALYSTMALIGLSVSLVIGTFANVWSSFVLLPVGAGISGFILSLLYNALAKRFGGIRICIE